MEVEAGLEKKEREKSLLFSCGTLVCCVMQSVWRWRIGIQRERDPLYIEAKAIVMQSCAAPSHGASPSKSEPRFDAIKG